MVFLAIFAILFLATFAYSKLPPGEIIYESFNFPTTTVKFLDTLPVRTLVNGVIKGVIYGIIVWIICTLARKSRQM